MEENYLLAREIVSTKFNKDYPYYTILVLGLYVLLCKYNENKEIVRDIFNNTNIYIEDDSLRNIVKKHDIKMLDFDSEEDDYSSCCCDTAGLSSHGNTYFISGDKVETEINNGFLICSTRNKGIEATLNVFVHEMNHLIKGYINGFQELDEEGFIGYHIRSGFCLYSCKYEPSTDLVYTSDYFNAIDEVVNTIETTEMLENVLTLDGIVPDLEVQSFIDSLDREKLSEDYGYELCVKLFRPLWANDTFRNLVEDNLLQGNLDYIILEFDKVIGEGSFEDIADLLEELDEADTFGKKGKKIERLKMKLKCMIKQYNKKTNFVYKK